MTTTAYAGDRTAARAGTQALGRALPYVFVLGVCAVLASGYIAQCAGSAHPCPLGVIQRMGLMLTAIGPAWILARGVAASRITASDYTTGFGFAAVAALVSAAVSAARPDSHRPVPHDSGYGAAFLGLHLHSWALIAFSLAALVAAGACLAAGELALEQVRFTGPARTALAVLAAVVAAGVVITFLESGLHWTLPANPSRYRFFDLFR
ncbi:MAG: disulfide bond formation protein B [Mycobacteriaceae bacterium]|nr:disulfide bond formation protein B [Mycobacteriaceae bacterium]